MAVGSRIGRPKPLQATRNGTEWCRKTSADIGTSPLLIRWSICEFVDGVPARTSGAGAVVTALANRNGSDQGRGPGTWRNRLAGFGATGSLSGTPTALRDLARVVLALGIVLVVALLAGAVLDCGNAMAARV